ncbi:hypothetical protein [Streptomyces sp. 35G-GA-8]|uniref:hypothetical protein n=1 Tax=Streptomyces sp. 35G-GA-8 TaxID=2939434 RepID=UPI00201F6C67|nr:hypothetical protein [Streptomyces sp. 35G-GA-8]MCL7375948.1 hypothetical protein [Streptomyces sp. 35G-GA-8]
MSGKKRILVDETEWYRAQRAAQNLRQVRRDVPRLLDEVRRRTEADQARTRAELEERARRTEQALSGLSAQTRRLEQDTGRRLREQSERLHKDLRDTTDRLERDTRTALDEHRAALERELAAERDQRHRDIAGLTGRLDELAGNRERAATATQGWLADGVTMSEFIATTLPHERHAPGRLDRLRLDLDTARRNSDIGHYEAALSLAQRAYLDLSELRLDIEHRELERRLAATAATDALVLVETLITENEIRPVMGPDGQPLPGVELDVDHWSEGELKELREQVAERLSRARDDATTAAAQRELTAEAADLEQRLGELVDRAGMRQLASQLRVNLADSVAETLSRIGAYELADGEYQDEDERRSYHAVLQHANGNKIVVQVLPAPDEETGQVMRVLSYDYDTVAEREIRDRAEAVRQALQEDGHPTGPLESELGVPEPEAPDLNRFRRHRAQPGSRTAPGGSS